MNANLSNEEVERLWRASRDTSGVDRDPARETGSWLPREGDRVPCAVGRPWKHGQPCPVCGAPVQRIVYADRETNYCPGCQTEGKILADRALSRLLRDDWPRTLEELEDVDWSAGYGQNPRRKGSR